MMTLAAAGHGIGNFKFFHPPTLPPVYCGKFELSIGESVQVKPSKPNKNQNLNKTKQTNHAKPVIMICVGSFSGFLSRPSSIMGMRLAKTLQVLINGEISENPS